LIIKGLIWMMVWNKKFECPGGLLNYNSFIIYGSVTFLLYFSNVNVDKWVRRVIKYKQNERHA